MATSTIKGGVKEFTPTITRGTLSTNSYFAISGCVVSFSAVLTGVTATTADEILSFPSEALPRTQVEFSAVDGNRMYLSASGSLRAGSSFSNATVRFSGTYIIK